MVEVCLTETVFPIRDHADCKCMRHLDIQLVNHQLYETSTSRHKSHSRFSIRPANGIYARVNPDHLTPQERSRSPLRSATRSLEDETPAAPKLKRFRGLVSNRSVEDRSTDTTGPLPVVFASAFSVERTDGGSLRRQPSRC